LNIVNPTAQIIMTFVFVVGAFVLSQFIVARRLRRAGAGILADLQRQRAFDAGCAVELDYAKPRLLRVGVRDMRPKALEDLIQGNIVAQTAEGKFYLKGAAARGSVKDLGIDLDRGRR
jgi:hypothetical protein